MALKKLGFVFDPSELSDLDVSIYSVISSEVSKIEKEDLSKAKGRSKR